MDSILLLDFSNLPGLSQLSVFLSGLSDLPPSFTFLAGDWQAPGIHSPPAVPD